MSDTIGQLIEIGILVKANGRPQQKVKCPKCSSDRRDKKDKSLSVNIKDGLYRCHYCGFTGGVDDNEDGHKYNKPTPSKRSDTDASVLKFFKDRGISETTVVANKITQENTWIARDDGKVESMVFNYFQSGRLVNKKYRSASKGFKLESGAKLIFYNIDNTIGETDVIITEGEIDTMSFFEAGFRNAISVPNGANVGQNNLQYLDNCIEYFNDTERIYLAVDNDDAGESLLNELSRRLGKDRCYRVIYPDGCKDANDVLINDGIEGVKQLIDKAEPFPIEGIVDARSETKSIMNLYNNGIERGEELEILGKEFDKLCTFQTGKLYTISGIPAHGKTTFVEYIEVMLAAKKGWKFGVFSPEHHPLSYMVYKYAELIVGKPFFEGANERMSKMELNYAMEFIWEHFFFIRPKDSMFTLDNILEIAGNLVVRHGIKGVTIDPWNCIEHDFGGKSETQYTEDALNKITLFKQEKDVAIFLVAHPKKMQKQKDGDRRGLYEVPSLYDISGSSNFFNKTDMGFTIYRDYSDNFTYFYMQKVKYRNLGEHGVQKFRYNFLNNRFSPWDEMAQDCITDNSNFLQKEVEQLEMMDTSIKPNKDFNDEVESGDKLPF